MTFSQFSIAFLLWFSALLGIKDIPTTGEAGWTINKRWESTADSHVFEATSSDVVKECQKNPSHYIQFPMVVMGAHELYLDQQKLLTFGDPTFQLARSYYGAPSMSC